MADVNQQTLNQLFASIGAGMGSLTREMEDFYRTATAEQQRMADAYEESLQDRVKGEDEVAKKRRATLMQIYKLEQQYRDKRDQLVKDTVVHNQRVQNAQVQYARALKAYNDAFAEGSKATKAQQDIAKQNLNIQRRDLTNAVLAQQSNKRAIGEADASFKKIFAERRMQEQKLGGFWSMAGERLSTHLKGVLTNALTQMFSGASFAAGLKEMFNTLQAEMSAGISMSLKDYTTVGAKLGLSPKEYAELTKASRDTVMAMGGYEGHLDQLNEATKLYTHTIGTAAEATAFAQEQLDILGRAGIKPTVGALQEMVPAWEQARKISNLSAKEFNAAIEQITEDEGTMFQLRAANSEAERMAIVKGIAGRIAENRAMGMTTKQAIEATKALNKLTSAGPLDRFKQAAKLRAMGGAMGVAGGEEASQVLIKGARATEDERRQLQDYLSKLSGAQSAAAIGTFGGEIFATALADKLGLQELLGASSPFNVRGREVLAVTKDAVAATKDMHTTLSGGVKTIEAGLNALLTNPLLKTGVGLLGSILGVLVGQSVGGAIGGIFKGGRGGRAAGKIGGKSLMKSAAKKIPVLGAVAGLGFAGMRAVEGDYTGAGLEAASGLASIVPGAGTAASVGIDAALAARDIHKATKTPSTEDGSAEQNIEELKEIETNNTKTISEQLSMMKEDNLSLKKMLTLLEESNDLTKELITAVTLSEEDKKKAMSVSDRLTMVREGSKRYKNAFS